MSFVMAEILSARETVDVEMYLISSKRIANAIVKARQKGIRIRMIIDAKLAKKSRSRHKFLMKKGAEVRLFKVYHGSMHNKFLVIDGRKLIAGSPNMSNDANYRNQEFLMVTEDMQVVRTFARRFEEMWKSRN